MWVGRAEVRGLLDDGRPVHYEWTFGGNPRKSREEAERFAYEAMLDRLRGKRGRFD